MALEKQEVEYTSTDLREQIQALALEAAQIPDIKPTDPYFFVGPTPPDPDLVKQMDLAVTGQDFLDKHVNPRVKDPTDYLTLEAVNSNSFRAKGFTQGLIPAVFANIAESIKLPKTHMITQVNGGGHQAGVATINHMVVLDPAKLDQQRVYVDVENGGAFRKNLATAQALKTVKRYFNERDFDSKTAYKAAYRAQIKTASDNTDSLPLNEFLEQQGVGTYIATINETSTGHTYSPEDFKIIREWKATHKAGEPRRQFIVDATSFIGAAEIPWDIIDGMYFPPQKAIKAPAETGFIVFSKEFIAQMEEEKPKGLNVAETNLFRKASIEEKQADKRRVLNDKHFFDPSHPEREMQVINSISGEKWLKTAIAAQHYLTKGGDEASISQGDAAYKGYDEWMLTQEEKFEHFTKKEENRSHSVAVIDIVDPRFTQLSPELQDRTLENFHALMDNKKVTSTTGKVVQPHNIAKSIKTFPGTPLPIERVGMGKDDKMRGIRFWLNSDPETKVKPLLAWIEPVFSQALQITLEEELSRVRKQENLERFQREPKIPEGSYSSHFHALKKAASSIIPDDNALRPQDWLEREKQRIETKPLYNEVV